MTISRASFDSSEWTLAPGLPPLLRLVNRVPFPFLFPWFFHARQTPKTVFARVADAFRDGSAHMGYGPSRLSHTRVMIKNCVWHDGDGHDVIANLSVERKNTKTGNGERKRTGTKGRERVRASKRIDDEREGEKKSREAVSAHSSRVITRAANDIIITAITRLALESKDAWYGFKRSIELYTTLLFVGPRKNGVSDTCTTHYEIVRVENVLEKNKWHGRFENCFFKTGDVVRRIKVFLSISPSDN